MIKRCYFREFSQTEYNNNAHLGAEIDYADFLSDMYTIEDYYADAGIQLKKINDHWYTFEIENDAGETVIRYVYIEKIDEVYDDEVFANPEE